MTQREESRQNWIGKNTVESVNAGSLQRIADAVETMAKSYNDLREESEKYQRWYRTERASSKRANSRISALQGVITKMKKAGAVIA